MQRSFKSTCRILIVGCGIGGLAAAIGIRKAGFSVLILEKASKAGEIGAGIQIPPNASRVLQHWGLLSLLKPYAINSHNVNIRSYTDGSRLSSQNLVPHCENAYGSPHIVIHRADLHAILMAEAERLRVEIKLGMGVSRIDFNKNTAYTSSGEVFHAHVIIGADGEKSICREELLRRPDPPRPTGDLVFRLVVKAEQMYQYENLRELIEPPNINMWFGPKAHAISYLLKKDDLFNVVLGRRDAETENAVILPQKVEISEVKRCFKDWDPRIQAILNLAEDASKWSLLQSNDTFSWSHPNGGFVLLGDSAHSMLPYLGQGAAQAIEDAAMLGILFLECQNILQLPDVLAIYESLRKQRAMEVRQRSREMGDINSYPEGQIQIEREKQLRLEPCEGHPIPWADPVLQERLWGYNVLAEAMKGWERYRNGTFVSTGNFISTQESKL